MVCHAISPNLPRCRLCESATTFIGAKRGKFLPVEFRFRRCDACGFFFVENPHPDQAEIYSDEYYAGRGADPYVDYLRELEQPHETVRVYEWRGILRRVQSMKPVERSTRWLDFSCGNGALVRYCREHTGCDIVGYEQSPIAHRARAAGIPILDEGELAAAEGTFDIVSAIEVLEHVEWPISFLNTVRRLLKPGGLFFFTTGNAEPHSDDLLGWRYALPEVHISYFAPATLAMALRRAGFEPHWPGYGAGLSDIIRFKALKSVYVRTPTWWEQALPWWLLARVADWRLQISRQPVAFAK